MATVDAAFRYSMYREFRGARAASARALLVSCRDAAISYAAWTRFAYRAGHDEVRPRGQRDALGIALGCLPDGNI